MNKDLRSDALKNGDIGIITAARVGKLDVVTRLVENNGVSVNFQESEGSPTPLMTAAIGGYIDIIRYLLSRGAGVNIQDKEQRTALINAALNNRPECVTLLMEHGADPNLFSKNGWTPLYIAANKGFKEIANILLFAYGQNNPTENTEYHTLNVNMAIQNTVGGTVLMVACMQGHYEIVQSLIGNGADVNARDKQNWTALMKAADKAHLNIVRLLLANGAEVSVMDNNGFTVLHVVAKSTAVNRTEVVKELLCHSSIDVNAVDKNGRSPLFYATQKKSLDVVEALLTDSRIDVHITDKNGATALTVPSTPEIQQALRDGPTHTLLQPMSGEKSADAVEAGRTDQLRQEMEELKLAAANLPPTPSPREDAVMKTEGLPSNKRKLVGTSPSPDTIRPMDTAYTAARWCGDVSAVDLILSAAIAGDPCANAYAALLFLSGCCAFPADHAVAQQHAKLALDWLEEVHSSTTQYLLGSFYYEGIGVSRNDAEALRLLQLAAQDKTHANAFLALNLFYQECDSTNENIVAAAIKWTLAAAELKHPHGLFSRGYFYLTGYGGPVDYELARKDFEAAATLGHATALTNLGTLHQHGLGVDLDEKKALNYFKNAAAKKDPVGLHNLAVFYQEGISVPADWTKAAELFQESAKLKMFVGNYRTTSIMRSDVPIHLRGGAFFNSLDSKDENPFDVPTNCFKLDDEIRTFDEFCQALRVAFFWGVECLSRGIVQFYHQNPNLRWHRITSDLSDCERAHLSDLRSIFCTDGESLVRAIELDRATVVDYLVDHKFHIHSTSPATAAAALPDNFSSLSYLRRLREGGYPWDEETSSAAAGAGHLECLMYMHEHEHRCPWDVNTLIAAAFHGRLDCLAYAHEHHLPWNTEVYRAALEGGHLPCLRYLNRRGCSQDFDTIAALGSRLLRAVQERNLQALDEAVASGANCDYVDEESGNYPLHVCVLSVSPQCAQRLIVRHRANPNLSSQFGSPLMLAASRGCIVMIQTLLPYSDVNFQNQGGRTALMDACRSNSRAAVEALIGARANLNLVNSRGTSALMIAAQIGNRDIVQYLRSHGADVNAMDMFGQTARDQAVNWGQDDDVIMLLS